MVSVRTLTIYHTQHATITPSASPLASAISSVQPNFTELYTRALVWLSALPCGFIPPGTSPKTPAHQLCQMVAQGCQRPRWSRATRKPTRISKQNKYQSEGWSYSKSCSSYILQSRCQLISFLHLRKLQSVSCSAFSEQLTHRCPVSGYPFSRWPAQIASIPLEQIQVPAEGLKHLFNLISRPLNTDMGTEVEIWRYHFTQGSFISFVLSPRLPHWNPTQAFHHRFPLQPMRQRHSHKTHQTYNRFILPAQQFLSTASLADRWLYPSTGPLHRSLCRLGQGARKINSLRH